MTITRLNAKYSEVTPDAEKALRMPNDERLYSVIVCKHKIVPKIVEVDAE